MSFFKKDQPTMSNEYWERSVLEKVAMASVIEQRRSRRWGIFFKMLFLLYIIILSGIAFAPLGENGMASSGPHTAVVDVKGVIMAGAEADAEVLIKSMNKAVSDPNTKGLIIRLNTPGGSPVQANYVYNAIMDIRKKNPDLPVYAVIEDLCASGGYYIAAAADKIFVNESSIVGSIGVVMNGFGFVDVLKTVGVERRMYTAGEHKGFLDPFSTVDAKERGHVQKMLNDIHAEFIKAVKTGRGDRLKNNPDIFSGLVWAGTESINLGLADEVGSVLSVAKNQIGAEKIVNYTPEKPFFEKLAKGVGAAMSEFALNLTMTGNNRLQ